jgi:hypothetical protein
MRTKQADTTDNASIADLIDQAASRAAARAVEAVLARLNAGTAVQSRWIRGNKAAGLYLQGTSEQEVCGLVKSGKLKCHKFGSANIFDRAELDRLILTNNGEPLSTRDRSPRAQPVA